MLVLSVTAGSLILHVMTCYEHNNIWTQTPGVMQIKLKEQHGGLNPEGIEEWRGEEAIYSHTRKLIHTHTVTEIPTIHMYLL